MARNNGTFDIWVMDLNRGTPSRLTFLEGESTWPVWTSDGKNIIFRSTVNSAQGLYQVRADGGGEAVRLTDGKLDDYPCSISPDGKRLLLNQRGNASSPDLFTAAIEGDSMHPKLGTSELFLGSPFIEAYAKFSPDGRWIAYASNESGTFEIYVRPFPGPGGRWQISTGGGSFPAWSRDGRELVYMGPDQRLMAVSYTAEGDSFSAGKPRVWSETRMLSLGTYATWDLAPDGKRVVAFLRNTDDLEKAATHLTFLLNFTDELQRRAAGR
jgi:serine/threonine-protein kinase